MPSSPVLLASSTTAGAAKEVAQSPAPCLPKPWQQTCSGSHLLEWAWQHRGWHQSCSAVPVWLAETSKSGAGGTSWVPVKPLFRPTSENTSIGRANCQGTRGNGPKLKESQITLALRKKLFIRRDLKHCHSLPRELELPHTWQHSRTCWMGI